MTNLQEIEKKIESLRSKLYMLFNENPNDPEIIKISQCLDKILNEYERNKSE